MVVDRVAIELEDSNFDEGEFGVGPDFCEVEWVPAEVFGLGFGHDLDADAPFGELSVFDSIVEVSLMRFAVFADEFGRFIIHEVFDSLHGFEVEFTPDSFALVVDERVGVASETVEVSIGFGDSAIGEEDGDLVERFGAE